MKDLENRQGIKDAQLREISAKGVVKLFVSTSTKKMLRVAGRALAGFAWTNAVHWSAMTRRHVWRGEWSTRSFQDLIGVWGAGLGWIMGIRIIERNERSGPKGDLIIANHLGFLDIPVLLTLYPSVFVIKTAFSRFAYFGRELARHGHVFVDPSDPDSRRQAREGVREALARGDRVIVFPEGRSSPGVERRPFKPFCLIEAARQGKVVEACVLDYCPDRRSFAWDSGKPIVPQILELFGRQQVEVSIEYLPQELVADPVEAAQRYHDLIEQRLRDYDDEREGGLPRGLERVVDPFRRILSSLAREDCWEESSGLTAAAIPADRDIERAA